MKLNQNHLWEAAYWTALTIGAAIIAYAYLTAKGIL